MTLAKFARLCESIEFVTPTKKTQLISQALSGFGDNKSLVIKTLALEYEANNIGTARAKTWISNALGIFEEELDNALYTWGELGESIAQMDEGNETDSDITMLAFASLLTLNCSRAESEAYRIFSENVNKMSAREKKWFIRYWVRKPRNGVNNKVPLKAMKLYFTDDKI